MEKGETAEQNQLRPEIILAFVRSLIRNTYSSDKVMLCIYSARDKTNASPEEVEILTNLIADMRS